MRPGIGRGPIPTNVEPTQGPDALRIGRVIAIQFALSLVLTVAALPFGARVAVSVLVGAGVCLVANGFFAFWVYRRYRAQEPGALLMRFYGAELAKIALILALFAAAFATIDGLHLPALLIAYFAVQVLPAVIASNLGAGSNRER